jgi:hypothetical protein
VAELDGLLHDYLSKGRRLQTLDMTALERRWIVCVQEAGRARQLIDTLREMDHIEAELQLRGREPPPPPGFMRDLQP